MLSLSITKKKEGEPIEVVFFFLFLFYLLSASVFFFPPLAFGWWHGSFTDSGRLVTDELKHVSRAVAVDNLTAIVSNLEEIRSNLGAIEQDTGSLQENARQLQVLFPPARLGPWSLSRTTPLLQIRFFFLFFFCLVVLVLQKGLTEVKRQLKLLMDRCATNPVCANFQQQYNLDALSVDLQFQEVHACGISPDRPTAFLH